VKIMPHVRPPGRRIGGDPQRKRRQLGRLEYSAGWINCSSHCVRGVSSLL
jgi:hypothetical protein